MDSITVPRSGKAPLKFEGKLLAEQSGKTATGRDRNRWHDVSIYRSKGGKYVASVTYRTVWQGEIGHDAAEIFDDGAEAAKWLEAFDPTANVGGYPPQDAYAAKQARLMADIRAAFGAQVSNVIEEAGITESVD